MIESRIIVFIIVVIFSLVILRLYNLTKYQNDNHLPLERMVRKQSEWSTTDYLPMLENGLPLEKQTEEKLSEQYNSISQKIGNDVYSSSNYWEEDQTHGDFLNKLTEQQRIYFTLMNFESSINNGGVYQFLFNNFELSIIALDAMKEVGLNQLAQDYQEVLKEFFGKFEKIEDLYLKFQDINGDWNGRWNSFQKGYTELRSTEKIEAYFYEDIFINNFHEKMIQYVKENPSKLYRNK